MTRGQVVAELMDEFGKTGDKVAARISQWVGDITVDLLTQNEGRFSDLEEKVDITIISTEDHYKLPANYNTAGKNFYEYDIAGEFVRRLSVITKADWLERKSQQKYSRSRVAYIEFLRSYTNVAGANLGRGYYLILGDEPDETGYYEFPYFRSPTAEDTDLIRNHEIVKLGVKGKAVDYNSNHFRDAGHYERRRLGFMEKPSKHSTDMITRPSRKTQKLNRKLHRVGRGL